MSLFGSIGHALSGVAKSVVGGVVGTGIGSLIGMPGLGGIVGSSFGGGGGGGKLPPSLTSMGSSPGASGRLPSLVGLSKVGKGVAAAGAVAAGADWLYNEVTGKWSKKKKRRKKGISAHDLKSFKRVARLIDKFAAPVHHLKKSSFKHHTK